MREYETTFIVQPEISDEGVQALRERLDGILEKQGAVKLMYDDMGRRRLGYEIRNFQKGQYFTLFFLDEGKAVPELERAMRHDDSVLRFLTVLADPLVKDIEARKAETAEITRIQAEKAAEKAAREAEEAARAAAESAAAAEEVASAPQGEADVAEESEPDAAEDEGEAPFGDDAEREG